MPRVYPTPGRGPAERGEAGVYRDGGTSRTPSPTGRLRVGRGCVNGYAQASVTQKPVGVGVADDPLFRRPRGKKTVQRKITFVGAGSHPRPYVRRPPTYRRRVFFRTTYSNQKCRPTGGIFTILRHGDANCNKKRPSGAFSQLPRRGAPKLQSVRRADTLAAEWVLRASGRGGRGQTRSCVGATPRRVTPSQTPARRLCACDSAYLGRYAAISMTGITSAAAVLMREALGLATGSSVIISSAAPLRSRTRAA